MRIHKNKILIIVTNKKINTIQLNNCHNYICWHQQIAAVQSSTYRRGRENSLQVQKNSCFFFVAMVSPLNFALNNQTSNVQKIQHQDINKIINLLRVGIVRTNKKRNIIFFLHIEDIFSVTTICTLRTHTYWPNVYIVYFRQRYIEWVLSTQFFCGHRTAGDVVQELTVF